jgi:hypothetical protein
MEIETEQLQKLKDISKYNEVQLYDAYGRLFSSLF